MVFALLANTIGQELTITGYIQACTVMPVMIQTNTHTKKTTTQPLNMMGTVNNLNHKNNEK